MAEKPPEHSIKIGRSNGFFAFGLFPPPSDAKINKAFENPVYRGNIKFKREVSDGNVSIYLAPTSAFGFNPQERDAGVFQYATTEVAKGIGGKVINQEIILIEDDWSVLGPSVQSQKVVDAA